VAPPVVSERAQGFVAGLHSVGPRLLQLVDLSKVIGETDHALLPRLDDAGEQTRAQLTS